MKNEKTRKHIIQLGFMCDKCGNGTYFSYKFGDISKEEMEELTNKAKSIIEKKRR